jgi:hypothetical protein
MTTTNPQIRKVGHGHWRDGCPPAVQYDVTLPEYTGPLWCDSAGDWFKNCPDCGGGNAPCLECGGHGTVVVSRTATTARTALGAPRTRTPEAHAWAHAHPNLACALARIEHGVHTARVRTDPWLRTLATLAHAFGLVEPARAHAVELVRARDEACARAEERARTCAGARTTYSDRAVTVDEALTLLAVTHDNNRGTGIAGRWGASIPLDAAEQTARAAVDLELSYLDGVHLLCLRRAGHGWSTLLLNLDTPPADPWT